LPDVKISPAGIVIGLAAILIFGAFGWLTFGPKPAPPPPAVLTKEARDYLPNLGLSNVHMQSSENYVNARVIEILGDITNKGTKTLKLAQVICVFRDYAGQEIARESASVVRDTLAPTQTRSFRLPFDTIPDSWNQQVPTLIIAQIQFE
jgi:hypothetical protein